MEDLAGRVAVVTGGASGIGRALAARLAREGMTVVIADVEAGALEATAAELGVTGDRDRRERRGVGPGPRRRRDGALRPGRPALQQRRRRWGRRRRRPRPGRLGVGARRQPVGRRPRPALVPAPPPRQPGRRPHRQHRVDGRSGRLRRCGALLRQQVRRRRAVRVAPAGADQGRRRRRCLGAVPRLREDQHLLQPAQPSGGAHRHRAGPAAGARSANDDIVRSMQALGIAPEAVADEVLAAISERRFWIFTHPDLVDAVDERHAVLLADRR